MKTTYSYAYKLGKSRQPNMEGGIFKGINRRKEKPMEDRCIMCGEIVPEGTQVCKTCLSKYGEQILDEVDSINYEDEFSFSEWLEVELKKSGMTQSQLARKVGVTQQSIGQYISGMRTPSIITANDVLNVFGKKFVVIDKKRSKVHGL